MSQFWQGLLALAGVLLLGLLAFRFDSVLASRGFALNFDFLWRTAGIVIPESVIPFSPGGSVGQLILAGLANTLRLVVLAAVLATSIGVGVGIVLLSGNPLARMLATCFVALLRNTPLLLQIFFWYAIILKLPAVMQAISIGDVAFLSRRGLQLPNIAWTGSPDLSVLAVVVAALCACLYLRLRCGIAVVSGLVILFGLALIKLGVVAFEIPHRQGLGYVGGLTLSPEFVAVVVAQSLYAGAFIAELVRGGIEGVPEGQKEAARSLGLTRWRMLREIVLPQALVVIIPSITTQYVSIIKNSSLAVAIGYPEMFWSIVSTINISGRSIEAILIMLLLYTLPTVIGTVLIERINRRFKARSRL